MQKDPYSLDGLQDIVQPDPVSWWPPAPFWWVVAGLIICWAVYFVVLESWRWVHNAYRREALRELRSIELQLTSNEAATGTFVRLSALLKRVALVSFPRTRVAALSGDDWLKFLNATCDHVDFLQEPIRYLGTASVKSVAMPDNSAEWQLVLTTVRQWIVGHRAELTG